MKYHPAARLPTVAETKCVAAHKSIEGPIGFDNHRAIDDAAAGKICDKEQRGGPQ